LLECDVVACGEGCLALTYTSELLLCQGIVFLGDEPASVVQQLADILFIELIDRW